MGGGDRKEIFQCKKINAIFAGTDPSIHKFVPLQYAFSDKFNNLINSLDLYEPLEIGMVFSTYFHKLLNPTYHIGKYHSMTQDNISFGIC